MGFSCVTRSLYSILPLLLLLSITPLSSSFSPSEYVTKESLDALCSQPSIYKHFCVVWLGSDPKTFTLDIQGLIGMATQKTEGLGDKNRGMLFDLGFTTHRPDIPYGPCVRKYDSSIQAIRKAEGFASSKDYVSAMKAAATALDNIAMCNALLEQKPIPAYAASSNLMFERMCNILRVFTNALIV
ncbi:unnamed protein product [Thlaspi arvense]|uniref:Pectinesterase inhibitor domain-containing protein n=1 Tax=Thlaspi arvense TaxID=13288 RepID=A0AAU9S258_THLAR|nr:unnamed protein product [Thlaspi arvense]